MIRKRNSKLFILLGVFIAIVLAYSYFHYRTYSQVKEDFVTLNENELLGKYLYLYSLTYNKTPDNIDNYKDFVRKQNIEYYNDIKNIDLRFIKDSKSRFDFYLLGFDKKDDLLNKFYNPAGMTFWSSFNKKGDIMLDNNYNPLLYKNGVHGVVKDTVIKIYNISMPDFYKKELNCEHIMLKNLNSELKNITARIKNKDVNILYNTFSNLSTQLFLDGIKNEKYFNLKDSIYLIKVEDYNVSEYKCDR